MALLKSLSIDTVGNFLVLHYQNQGELQCRSDCLALQGEEAKVVIVSLERSSPGNIC